MNKIIFMSLLAAVLNAGVPAPCKSEAQMLREKSIDLDTKTLKGWVRILNNKSKQGLYGVTLTREETIALIKCLTEEIGNRREAGKIK
jgi:hypothetical protein